MSEQNTFKIPTAPDIAKEIIAQMAEKGFVVPGKALGLEAAAGYLDLSEKQVRALVENKKIRAGNASLGTGQKATLRFSIRELDRFLAGE